MKDKNKIKLWGGGQCKYVLQLGETGKERKKREAQHPGVWQSGTANMGARQLDREDHCGALFEFLGGRLDQDFYYGTKYLIFKSHEEVTLLVPKVFISQKSSELSSLQGFPLPPSRCP